MISKTRLDPTGLNWTRHNETGLDRKRQDRAFWWRIANSTTRPDLTRLGPSRLYKTRLLIMSERLAIACCVIVGMIAFTLIAEGCEL